MSIRRLKVGEQIPTGAPRRYTTRDGYWLLRWRLEDGNYVEALEHRLIAGVVTDSDVHHINGNRKDNRPENLQILTRAQHAQTHHFPSFDLAEARRLYAEGWSLPKLAKRYGLNNVTVMRTLKRHGVTMRGLKEAWSTRRDEYGPNGFIVHRWSAR